LVTRRVDGFALKQKRWMGFDIEGIEELTWSPDENSAMSQLILPRRDIEIIKALSSRHMAGNTKQWGADFIPGKGEGQVFLLHGPPGTGKTYTVECVADYTRRPLVYLTVADIGTDEVLMETNLSRWFTVAASWQAVILIDEADVFLERRQGANLQRNSLVSVFLRCMEYYPGMLFLTTNRIGQIDDAFLSRTSVALTYEPLNASVRLRIWDGFLSKLERERGDVIVTDRARTFLEEDEDMKSVPWNGREIRNGKPANSAILRTPVPLLTSI
jgi:replication-associated recombination protein RarA